MKSLVIQKDNLRYGKYMPMEDAYLVKGNVFCVADGITRDPLGISDYTGTSMDEILQTYPNPSPATAAAKVATQAYVTTMTESLDATAAMRAANAKVAELNQDKTIDYLIDDYAGCVAAGGIIQNDELHWASIGDCQITVFDRQGVVKLVTLDGVAAFTDYEQQHPRDWAKPEYRKSVRSQFRNNPAMIKDGACVAFGALTGEDVASQFIMTGKLALEPDDTVVCYSDGFAGMVAHPEFFTTLKQGEVALDKLDVRLGVEDPGKFTRERTMVILTEFSVSKVNPAP